MELWVIEASGKVKFLQETLTRLGRSVLVRSTKGHIMTMPELSNLGIDKNLYEHARYPKFDYIFTNLRNAAQKCDKLVIATDADEEGDAIAWDVFELLSDTYDNAARVKLKGLDDESILESISEAKAINKADAVPARTRAILDRLIGATFSNDVGVGRVKTAILGLVNTQKPSIYRIMLTCPAKDRGKPWFAECDVKPPLTKEWADELVSLALPPLDFKSSSNTTATPGHLGRIMVRAGDVLGTSVAESNGLMQKLYENGKMSYPRSGSTGMSRTLARKLAKIYKDAGYNSDFNRMPEKAEKEVHDVPVPLGPVNVGADPKKLGDAEGLRVLIAKDLVKSTQVHKVEKPELGPLERFLANRGFPYPIIQLVAGLHWRREQGPAYPGQEKYPVNKMIERRPDVVLLEMCMENGLGKPSTWANHIDNFIKAGLVDETLRLTDKGLNAIKKSPPDLLDPKWAVAIEDACSRIDVSLKGPPDKEPWEFLAGRIIDKLPDSIKIPLKTAINSTDARPRVSILDHAHTIEKKNTTANKDLVGDFSLEDDNAYGYRMDS